MNVVKNKKHFYNNYYNSIKNKLTLYKHRETFLPSADEEFEYYTNSDKYFSRNKKKYPSYIKFNKKILFSITTFAYTIYTPINKKIFTPDGLLVCMKPSISEDEIKQNKVSSTTDPLLSLRNKITMKQSNYHSNDYVKMYKSIFNCVIFLGIKNSRKIIKIIDDGKFDFDNELIKNSINKIRNSRYNITAHEFILNFTTPIRIDFIKFLLNVKV